MSFKSFATAVAAAALVSITSAQAASVDLVSVDGIWLDPQPGAVYGITGVGTSALSWGMPAGYGQSGYTFDGAAPPVVTDVPVSSLFKLGTFTHHNNPIKASPGDGLAASITSATLQVTFGLEIDGDREIGHVHLQFRPLGNTEWRCDMRQRSTERQRRQLERLRRQRDGQPHLRRVRNLHDGRCKVHVRYHRFPVRRHHSRGPSGRTRRWTTLRISTPATRSFRARCRCRRRDGCSSPVWAGSSQ